MFAEHQVVQTRECLTRFTSALPAKSRGTIIHVWKEGVYEVEFPTYRLTPDGRKEDGNPVIETLYEHELEPCTEAL